jgi:hypothetical protein
MLLHASNDLYNSGKLETQSASCNFQAAASVCNLEDMLNLSGGCCKITRSLPLDGNIRNQSGVATTLHAAARTLQAELSFKSGSVYFK